MKPVTNAATVAAERLQIVVAGLLELAASDPTAAKAVGYVLNVHGDELLTALRDLEELCL